MRKRALAVVHDMAREDKNVVFVGSDLGVGVLQEMKEELPGQFFMEGASEQHIIGMSAGMAMSGKTVFVNTIGSFLTRRCYEQNLVDLGFHRTRVRLISLGGGTVYAPQGATHMALEDIAIMRAIPNMTVVVPADAEEMERAVRASAKVDGPVYFRVAKGGDPIVGKAEGFALGKAAVHREPGDVLFVTTGVMLDRALDAAKLLDKQGIASGIVHAHTVKPFDCETVSSALAKVRAVVTLEEGMLVGGLGSIVAELIAESALEKPPRLKRLGLPDEFPDEYGSQDSLLARYGMSVEDIAKTASRLLEQLGGK